MTSSTESPPVALAVAGSDSGGGAGIQADLKAMTWQGVHGCTALTALTAQNTRGVQGIHPVPGDFLRQQIQSVTTDFDVDATKTGMLFNGENIEVVVEEAEDLGALVVDPVMVSATGDPLMEEEAERGLVTELLPRAELVTPNWSETRRIADRLSIDIDQPPETIGREIAESLDGPAILLKGGHLDEEEAIDRLIDPDGTLREYSAPRIDTENTHGSGCVYSSLIAANLAKSTSLEDAVDRAKQILTGALESGYACGDGIGTLNLLRDGDSPSI